MVSLQEDIGWDSKLIKTKAGTKFDILQKELIDPGLVCYYDGNTYIYLTQSNIWAPFISSESQRQLCDITGSESATVNYLNACTPYFGFLQKRAYRITSLPQSICIGTWRLIITSFDDGSMKLEKCKDIANADITLDHRIRSFCAMPCALQQIPTSWAPNGEMKLYWYLGVLFHNPLELDTIRWIIGNALVDPGYSSKFLLLYGPGGTGKSTLIKCIQNMFIGCSGSINSSSLTNKFDMDDKTARIIASMRLVTAGDINLATQQLNFHTVKQATGHDSFSIPPFNITTRCTIVGGCNNLPNIIDQPEWCTPALSRRVVVVPMEVSTIDIPNVVVPTAPEELLEMMLSCVDLFLRTPVMPISMRSVLYTILGSSFELVQHAVKFTEGGDIQDAIDANYELERYFALPFGTIGSSAITISRNIATMVDDRYILKNISVIESLNVADA